MKIIVSIFMGLFFSSSLLASDSGYELYNQKCISCHVSKGGNRLAPPIFAVVAVTKHSYPRRVQFVQRIVDWVKEPSAERALMEDAVNLYGVMPLLPYSESEVTKIAEYLYEK